MDRWVGAAPEKPEFFAERTFEIGEPLNVAGVSRSTLDADSPKFSAYFSEFSSKAGAEEIRWEGASKSPYIKEVKFETGPNATGIWRVEPDGTKTLLDPNIKVKTFKWRGVLKDARLKAWEQQREAEITKIAEQFPYLKKEGDLSPPTREGGNKETPEAEATVPTPTAPKLPEPPQGMPKVTPRKPKDSKLIPEKVTYEEGKSDAFNRGIDAHMTVRSTDPDMDVWFTTQQWKNDKEQARARSDFEAGVTFANTKTDEWDRYNTLRNYRGGEALTRPEEKYQRGFTKDPVDRTKRVMLLDEEKSMMWNWGATWGSQGLNDAETRDRARRFAHRAPDGDMRPFDQQWQEGWAYAQEQKNAYVEYQKTGEVPDGVTLNPKLYPEVAEAPTADPTKFAGAIDLTDESWKKTDLLDGWSLIGYQAFKPDFAQSRTPQLTSIPEFQDSLAERSDVDNAAIESEINVGYSVAAGDWARHTGAVPTKSEEWNNGVFFFKKTNTTPPDNSPSDFLEGFDKAMSDLITNRLRVKRKSIADPKTIEAERQEILNARARNESLPEPVPLMNVPGKDYTADSWRAIPRATRRRMMWSSTSDVKSITDNDGDKWHSTMEGTFTSFDKDKSGYSLENIVTNYIDLPETIRSTDLGKDPLATVYELPKGSKIQLRNGKELEWDGKKTLLLDGKAFPTKQLGILLGTATARKSPRVGIRNSKSKESVGRGLYATSIMDQMGLSPRISRLLKNTAEIDHPDSKQNFAARPGMVAYVHPQWTNNEAPHTRLRSEWSGVSEAQDNHTTEGMSDTVWKPKHEKDWDDVPYRDGIKVSQFALVPGSTFQQQVMTHESGHFIEATVYKMLDDDELHDFYHDMSEALLSTLSEEDREKFAQYSHSSHARDKGVRGGFDARLYQARRFIEITDNTHIPAGLSHYGASDTRELIAEMWGEYKLSPKPRPIAAAMGPVLERAMNVADQRIGDSLNGVDPAERYKSATRPDSSLSMKSLLAGDKSPSTELGLEQWAQELGIEDFSLTNNGFNITTPAGVTKVNNLNGGALAIEYPGFDSKIPEVERALESQGRANDLKRLIAPGDSTIARLGYDFEPATLVDTMFDLMVEATPSKVPTKYADTWEKWRAAIREQRIADYPTAAEVFNAGWFGDGNILDRIQWIGTKRLTGPDQPPKPSFDLPEAHVDTHSDIGDGSPEAAKLYRQAVHFFRDPRMKDALRDIIGGLSYGDDPATGADLIVDYYYYPNPPPESVRAAALLDKYREDLDLSGIIPDFKGFLDNNPEAKDVLDNFSTNFGDINDKIRYQAAPTPPVTTAPKPAPKPPVQVEPPVTPPAPTPPVRTQPPAPQPSPVPPTQPPTAPTPPQAPATAPAPARARLPREVEILDATFEKVPGITEATTIHIPTNKTDLFGKYTTVKDEGYLRGTRERPKDDGSAYLEVTLPVGTKVLFDGDAWILPRGMVFEVTNSDKSTNTMIAEVSRGHGKGAHNLGVTGEGVLPITDAGRGVKGTWIMPPINTFGRAGAGQTRTQTLKTAQGTGRGRHPAPPTRPVYGDLKQAMSLEEVLALGPQAIAKRYFGVGIPPAVWAALLRFFTITLPFFFII